MSYERCMAEAERCLANAQNETLPDIERKLATLGEVDWRAAALDYQPKIERYRTFLEDKSIAVKPNGFTVSLSELNPMLLDWQKPVVRLALAKGRYGLFEAPGCGKTFQQLEWANHICRLASGDVIILAPLAVAEQTVREGAKFGIPVTICRSQKDAKNGINITNYEMAEHFDLGSFVGVVLDESSCIKNESGKFRQFLNHTFKNTPYKLSCSATPSPNDYMELGTQAEFLGVMTRAEMLATFFVHDGGDTSQWRLKGHAQSKFWEWVCSWSLMIQKPSDIGYDDTGYDLTPLIRHQHVVDLGTQIPGMLFTPDKLTLTERRDVRKSSLENRVAKCAEIVLATDEQFIVWCGLNAESEALAKAIPGSVQVSGSDSREFKTKAAIDFAECRIQRLISKPSIFGYGMNWQNCRNMAFVGLSDSFEDLYQAERRCWRFGQTRDVHSHIIVSDGDGPVVANIQRKERDFESMAAGMIEHMAAEMQKELSSTQRSEDYYRTETKSGNGWECKLGDSIPHMMDLADGSIHYTVSSLPFASLYTYSNSDRDMGNSKDYAQFFEHFQFLADELFRVTMNGRLASFHCMNLPTSKVRDGYIGIRDFRGDVIRSLERAGFIFHSEVVIWKDPVTAMQRTKALGLLYKQLRKDSCMSRQGIPDYVVTFRKPGENPERVTKTHESFTVDLWQNYASPVWMDIEPNDTLQRESARDHADEAHICPLQLQVIERCIQLWSNPGDLVLDPFGGIGSVGYQAIKMDRRALLMELKESYFNQCWANLAAAETAGKNQYNLFAEQEVAK